MAGASMTVVCPVCETSQPLAEECVTCGAKLPGGRNAPSARVDPLEGLEPTLIFDPRAEVPLERAPDLELTPLGDPAVAVVPEMVPDIELDRFVDPDGPTALPDATVCVYCGAPVTDRVCDNCGRATSKIAPPEKLPGGEVPYIFCPQCQSRVPHELFCRECKSPLPLREIL